MIRCDKVIFIGCLMTMLTCLGCAGEDFAETSVAECIVQIDGQPAADVRVVMTESDKSLPMLEGITDQLGIARMRITDAGEFDVNQEQELRVTVESLGDWQFKSKWFDAAKSTLRATYVPDGDSIMIEIPKGAVEHL